MKIEEKISLLKKTIKEIKYITENIDHNYVSKKKFEQLDKEITRLKNGINEIAEELEEYLKEQNA